MKTEVRCLVDHLITVDGVNEECPGKGNTVLVEKDTLPFLLAAKYVAHASPGRPKGSRNKPKMETPDDNPEDLETAAVTEVEEK